MTLSALPPTFAPYRLDAAHADAQLERQLGQLGRLSRSELAALGRQLARELRDTRRLLRLTKAERKRLRAELRTQLREALKELRARRRQILADARRQAAEVLAQMKGRKTQTTASLAQLEHDQGEAIGWLQERVARLGRQRGALDDVTGRGAKLRAAYQRRVERQAESDDAVEHELGKVLPQALPWWHAHKGEARWRKAPAKMSRAEAILHYLHGNPEKMLDAQMAEADARVAAAEQRQAALARQHARVQSQRQRRREGLAGRAGRGAGARARERLYVARKRSQEAPDLGPADWDPFAEPAPLPPPAPAVPVLPPVVPLAPHEHPNPQWAAMGRALDFAVAHRAELGPRLALLEAVRSEGLSSEDASRVERLLDGSHGKAAAAHKLLAREQRQHQGHARLMRPKGAKASKPATKTKPTGSKASAAKSKPSRSTVARAKASKRVPFSELQKLAHDVVATPAAGPTASELRDAIRRLPDKSVFPLAFTPDVVRDLMGRGYTREAVFAAIDKAARAREIGVHPDYGTSRYPADVVALMPPGPMSRHLMFLENPG